MNRIFGLILLALSLQSALPNSPTIGGSFVLTNHLGKKVSEKDFTGKYLLVFFGFTHCPSACPLGMHTLSQVLKKLGSKRAQFQPLFISVDPKRDTPEVLKVFVKKYGDSFIGLTGTESELATLIKQYRGYFQKLPGGEADPKDYLFDHSTLIYLMDKNSRYLAHYESGEGAEKISEAILSILHKP